MTVCSLTAGGSVIFCCPPCELRIFRARLDSVALSPGRSVSSLDSRVNVFPGAPVGRVMLSVTDSPGHGRHSGCH